MIPANVIRATVVLATVFAAGLGAAPSMAQQTSSDVAYVEAVSGRVVAAGRENPVLVKALEVISEQTRFDLLPNSELRLCHYHMTDDVLHRQCALWISTAQSRPCGASPVGLPAWRTGCWSPRLHARAGGAPYWRMPDNEALRGSECCGMLPISGQAPGRNRTQSSTA
jgi:hypothetical protein